MRSSRSGATIESMIELDSVLDDWQFALDAAGQALSAAAHYLPADELHARRQRLAAERLETEDDLEALAASTGATHHPWLAPFPIHPSLLGVADPLTACIFDLEGVLTNGGALHAAAWADVLDDLLLRSTDATGRRFVPFDRVADYAAYLDDRPRLEGIHLFLQSRGIQVPVDDANALARRKTDALGRHMREVGVNALPGARAYLEATGRARLGRAVVSSSTRTLPMLELAGLATLVEARVDAEQIAAGELRARPAPDLLVRACELLEVDPSAAVSFTHTPDGVAAARAAGMQVVGVACDEPTRERLRGFGADVTVARLVDLLDGRLVALAA
jgi:HAD superfamily hydrolase (TIGR01509 family)